MFLIESKKRQYDILIKLFQTFVVSEFIFFLNSMETLASYILLFNYRYKNHIKIR